MKISSSPYLTRAPQTLIRYCHVYKEGELASLVGAVPGLVVREVYYDSSNWCVLAERT